MLRIKLIIFNHQVLSLLYVYLLSFYLFFSNFLRISIFIKKFYFLLILCYFSTYFNTKSTYWRFFYVDFQKFRTLFLSGFSIKENFWLYQKGEIWFWNSMEYFIFFLWARGAIFKNIFLNPGLRHFLAQLAQLVQLQLFL